MPLPPAVSSAVASSRRPFRSEYSLRLVPRSAAACSCVLQKGVAVSHPCFAAGTRQVGESSCPQRMSWQAHCSVAFAACLSEDALRFTRAVDDRARRHRREVCCGLALAAAQLLAAHKPRGRGGPGGLNACC